MSPNTEMACELSKFQEKVNCVYKEKLEIIKKKTYDLKLRDFII